VDPHRVELGSKLFGNDRGGLHEEEGVPPGRRRGLAPDEREALLAGNRSEHAEQEDADADTTDETR
jgi:hypothetical protein